MALKNTPLAPLTATSYEKLRPIHKVAGYTCIFTSVLHGVVYLAAWSESGNLAEMKESKNFAGAIAGMAMVIIGMSTITYIMRAHYERESVIQMGCEQPILITQFSTWFT
jgi:cytochrome bd-type quinol oxidase subunit 2